MEISSFTIIFPEHKSKEEYQYCLTSLESAGGVVKETDVNIFEISCDKEKALNHIGWALFHTHYKDICRVIGVKGNAKNSKNAYAKPSARK